MITQIIHNRDGSAAIRFQYDPVFISQLKLEVPSWSRSYEPTSKIWTIQRPYVDRVLTMMRERFGYVEVYGEPVTFNRNPNSECGCDSAHRTLKVCQDAPPEVVKAAYRALCKQVHPDRGGDHTQMIVLTEAYERVMSGAR